LAATIRAEHAKPLALREEEREAVHQPSFGVRRVDAHVFQVENALAAARGLQRERELLLLRSWAARERLLGAFDARALLGGAGRWAAAEPIELLAQKVLAVLLGALGQGDALGLA